MFLTIRLRTLSGKDLFITTTVPAHVKSVEDAFIHFSPPVVNLTEGLDIAKRKTISDEEMDWINKNLSAKGLFTKDANE